MRFDRRSDIECRRTTTHLSEKKLIGNFIRIEFVDQRVKQLYDVSEKELKEESYAIFFKSLDEILEQVGIPHDRQIYFA